VELQSRTSELKARGLGLAVITYDSLAVLQDFSRRRGITFPLLSDPGSRTIKQYGILNTTVPETSSTHGIPFPGTFIINRRGEVTGRFFEEPYQERTTVARIMLALGEHAKPAAARRITTDHLEITTYTSDEVVAPGSVFSIVFDIVPRQGIHVYAPGPHTYKIVTFNLAPTPLLIARPVEYPPSEIYFFAPLKERVPVFQKPFRLTQSMAFSTTPESRAALAKLDQATINGTLAYQACDDRVCFLPQSIPVSYSVKLRRLDTERAVGAK
jgi:peroxiredoxin